ncbi:YaaC family protein [Aquibacillus saliphilus]|uniref:YaaC family protein n=1 Tax=Aquibacillus saliphilus TaxID=1909422 RepID=UPI001CF03197|nr:YaaC family protein [Aquibacillus saliphilus]
MFQQDISNFLVYLKSAHTSQKYLKNCYIQNQIQDPEKRSYQNCYRFLYYLEHGQAFYQSGIKSDIVIKPILFFYGMVHLLKACLLTKRPDYPENTAMLSHGVSTRKLKKQQYAFLNDEIKIQHKGLFPYFSKYLFEVNQLPFQKINMNQLLAAIPELNDLFMHHRGSGKLTKIGYLKESILTFDSSLLDSYHITETNFINKLTNYLVGIESNLNDKDKIMITLSKPLSPSSKGPFFFHASEEAFYFPKSRHYFSTSHEVMNHYLLLYNLSMISRYETEWWGDLLHTLPTEDYPFIQQFLTVTSTKVPTLLGYFLLKQHKD